ncbi:hypothetical protein ACN27B_08485 [Micromonospora sp. WMMD754]|uniref:hypothetical protein n=1 Tax=Micromonospora sp. WMMD754 TaxID=3404114 RepID=UPI003BF4BC19
MTAAPTIPSYPHFAPGEHRQAIAAINRWLRTNGWTRLGSYGYRYNAPNMVDATVCIGWSDSCELIGVSRRGTNGGWQLTPFHHRVTHPAEAVRCLIAVGVLPVGFEQVTR